MGLVQAFPSGNPLFGLWCSVVATVNVVLLTDFCSPLIKGLSWLHRPDLTVSRLCYSARLLSFMKQQQSGTFRYSTSPISPPPPPPPPPLLCLHGTRDRIGGGKGVKLTVQGKSVIEGVSSKSCGFCKFLAFLFLLTRSS